MTADELRSICVANNIAVSLAGFIREADVARLLAVDTRTLQRWRVDSVGPAAVAIGRSWSYPLTEIARTLTPTSDDKRRHSSIDDATVRTETHVFSRRAG